MKHVFYLILSSISFIYCQEIYKEIDLNISKNTYEINRKYGNLIFNGNGSSSCFLRFDALNSEIKKLTTLKTPRMAVSTYEPKLDISFFHDPIQHSWKIVKFNNDYSEIFLEIVKGNKFQHLYPPFDFDLNNEYKFLTFYNIQKKNNENKIEYKIVNNDEVIWSKNEEYEQVEITWLGGNKLLRYSDYSIDYATSDDKFYTKSEVIDFTTGKSDPELVNEKIIGFGDNALVTFSEKENQLFIKDLNYNNLVIINDYKLYDNETFYPDYSYIKKAVRFKYPIIVLEYDIDEYISNFLFRVIDLEQKKEFWLDFREDNYYDLLYIE